MAEIKFDGTRMREIYNRLDEITEQLKTSLTSANEALSQIEGKIKGTTVTTVLKGYRESNETLKGETCTQMLELQTYLDGQIKKYAATEETSTEAVAEVSSILEGIVTT